jgi:hypothetical protein
MLGLDKQHYLCAENGGGAVNCNRLVAAQWETSTLEVFPEGLALHVDRQRNLGLNHKPNVWVAHDAHGVDPAWWTPKMRALPSRWESDATTTPVLPAGGQG